MRQLIVLIMVALATCLPVAAQTVQNGVTLEYRGKQAKMALAKVQLVVSGATAISGDDGAFTLNFQTLKRGQKVNVSRIAKSGYVIFNKDALEQWYVTEGTETFKVVLCKAELFDDLVNTYFGVSMQSYTDQLQKAQAEARRLKEQGKIKEEELNQRLREAEEAYQRAMDQLQTNSELMARIDESELDSLDQHAINLTKTGHIDEAVELILQKNTSELIQQTIRKRDEAAAQQQYYEQKQHEAREQLTRLIASRKNDIKILQAQGGKANYDLCWQYWIEIAEADTTNGDNVLSCANFLREQNDYTQAVRYYDMTLRLYRRLVSEHPETYNPQLATVLNNLGLLHTDLRNFTLAEQEYNEALALRRLLAAANPEAYNPMVALTLNNLATLYYQLHDYDKAEQAYGEALAIRRVLAAADPEQYNLGLANTLNNLANLHSMLRKFTQAEPEYNEALTIRRLLAATNPEEYNPAVASTLNNLAILYMIQQQYDLAEQAYNESLAIRRLLAVKNPDVYNPMIAQTLNNMANLHYQQDNYEQAELEYKESLAIRRQLAAANPKAYNTDVANTLYNLALMYDDSQRYALSEQSYAEALAIFRLLAAANATAYNPKVAGTLNNLAILHAEMKKNDLAEQEYNEALALYRQLEAENPGRYADNIEMLEVNIARLK